MLPKAPLPIETVIGWLLFLLLIAIVCYFIYKIIVGAISASGKAKAQAISVMARYRNRLTAAMYEDLMNIPIAGLTPLTINMRDFLTDMFPSGMAELERQRTKNPEVWRNNIQFLAPILIRMKAFAVYGGQAALNKGAEQLMGFAKQFFSQIMGVSEAAAQQQNQSSSADPDKRDSGNRTS